MTAVLQQAFSSFQYVSSGGNSKGDVVVTADRIVIVQNDIAATKAGTVVDSGIALMPKATSGGSAIADGKKVYWTGSVITETASGNTPCGFTQGASLDADATQAVRFETQGKAITNSSTGTPGTIPSTIAQRTIIIPVGLLASIVNTTTWQVTIPHAFKVISALFRTVVPATTGSKLATLTVATTAGALGAGGVMALTSVNQTPTGNATPASAISGANISGTAGQNVIVTASAVTAFVEGSGYIELVIENTDELNAIATLAAK